jgi:hypothetical protein
MECVVYYASLGRLYAKSREHTRSARNPRLLRSVHAKVCVVYYASLGRLYAKSREHTGSN